MLTGEVIFMLDDSGKKIFMKNWKKSNYGKKVEVVSVTHSKNEAGVFLVGTQNLLKEILHKLNVDNEYLWKTEEVLI